MRAFAFFIPNKHLALWNPTDLIINRPPITRIDPPLHYSAFDFSSLIVSLSKSGLFPIQYSKNAIVKITPTMSSYRHSYKVDPWCQGRVENVLALRHMWSRSVREGSGAAMTLLMQCFCVVKQGHRFTEEQWEIKQQWQTTNTQSNTV